MLAAPGTRWAKRVMPAVLLRLMRHADISTTMGYYVDLDAGDLSVQLWAGSGPAHGNTAGLGNIPGNIGEIPAEAKTRKTLSRKDLGR